MSLSQEDECRMLTLDEVPCVVQLIKTKSGTVVARGLGEGGKEDCCIQFGKTKVLEIRCTTM